MPRKPRPLLDTVDASENNHLPSALPTVQTTRTRFWVLFVFCLLAICQSCTWNIYSPIYKFVLLANPSWTSSYVNWLINAANISFGLSLYPISIAIHKFGARQVTIFSSVMIFLGTSLRCIPIEDDKTQQIIQVVAMLCNGVGGAYLNFGGCIISELWFPTNERTTATAVASVATYCGAALGFVVGPTLVGRPTTAEAATQAINALYYGETAVCLLGVVLCICYFPNRPKNPPSEAAYKKREAEEAKKNNPSSGMDDGMSVYSAFTEDDSVLGGVGGGGGGGSSSSTYRRTTEVNDSSNNKGLCAYFACTSKVRKYWVVSLCMGLPLGIFQGWGATMYSCLKPLEFTESEASWLGFFTTIVGCVGSVLVGAVLDRFAGRLKLTTAICLLVATVSFILFGVNTAGYLDIEQHERVVSWVELFCVPSQNKIDISRVVVFFLYSVSVFAAGTCVCHVDYGGCCY